MRTVQLEEAYDYCRQVTSRAIVPLKTKLAVVPQYWFKQQLEMRVKDVNGI